MKQMSRRERLVAAVHGEPTDRVPLRFWRHFPTLTATPPGSRKRRCDPRALRLGLPQDHARGGYAVEEWGCVESPRCGPTVTAVRDVRGSCGGRLEAHPCPRSVTAAGYCSTSETIIRMGFDRRIGDTPVVPTVFSPLSLARKLSGDRLRADLRRIPTRAGALERSRRR